MQSIEVRRQQWRAENRGVLAKLARELGFSPPLVSDVFYKRRTTRTGELERRLAELGAPGFEARGKDRET